MSQLEWRQGSADRAALLFDGAGYYGALRSSLLGAKRRICLAGWDIDSRTPVRGSEEPDDGAPLKLGELLTHLVEQKPELSIHILLWDYSFLYALEREPLPRLNLDWRTPNRIEVCLDSRLPFGTSHHERIAVVDDNVAYCGGLDLTIRRWDRPNHRADDSDRKDPGGEPYGPYHDVQMVVDGEAAQDLAELVRRRWNRTAQSQLEALETDSDVWPQDVEPDFRDISVGISRTRPAFDGDPELRQVEAAYLDAISKAERIIYIENQYLTACRIARAICDRMREKTGIETIIVNPEMPGGWLAAQAMDAGRGQFLRELAHPEISDRVGVFYPWASGDGENVAVMVHSKLMIVDDRLLHVGSSNLNRRSMGTDRECDLRIGDDKRETRAAIGQIRQKLIAHHLGLDVEQQSQREREKQSILASIDDFEASDRGLARLERAGDANDVPTELLVELADPEQPIEPDKFIGDLFGALPDQPIRRNLLKLLSVAVAIAAVVLLWRYSPLVEYVDPERLGTLFETIGQSAWTGPLLTLAFVAGSFLFFPVTVMIASTSVALPPVPALIWAFAGTLLAASANFAVGRFVSRKTLEGRFGRWIDRVSRRLQRGGIVSVMLVRNLPIAPFTVVNLVAGAARIPFRDYLIGTALGMAPGLAALTLLGDRLRGTLTDPSWINFSLLAVAIAVWIGLAFGLQALSNRLADRG